MPPKGAATRIKPLHLQTIQKLRVKSPNTHQANPCLAVMTSVLSQFPPLSLLLQLVAGLPIDREAVGVSR
ncbi:hypothetical protein EMCG_02104 [[Emmonsia] crescens]|uniref:Uncharacterized protein n=1 Tax=[Emmonsia] crescens TaxID=73230 RepID=A0A0G2HZ17_9EURO|nr:hypothetical protein EMCG_02104 [Emmonsia crescens UAMH 3008]